MTQAEWALLTYRIVTIAAFCSLAAWIVVYSRVAAWWRNPVGQALVAKTAIIALLLIPTILSLFFHFSPATSWAAGWIDAALIGAITPVMLWRCRVWVRLSHDGTTGQLPAGDPEPGKDQP